MLPATISVAPNSPKARANDSSRPARMPRQASGSETRKNTAHSLDTQRACGVFQLRVDHLEGRPRRLEHQRKGHHGGGDHRRLPGEDQADAEVLQQPGTEHTLAADHHQQVVAQHGGRHHHRQGQHRVDQVAPGKAPARHAHSPRPMPSTRLMAVAQPATFRVSARAVQAPSMAQRAGWVTACRSRNGPAPPGPPAVKRKSTNCAAPAGLGAAAKDATG